MYISLPGLSTMSISQENGCLAVQIEVSKNSRKHATSKSAPPERNSMKIMKTALKVNVISTVYDLLGDDYFVIFK